MNYVCSVAMPAEENIYTCLVHSMGCLVSLVGVVRERQDSCAHICGREQAM